MFNETKFLIRTIDATQELPFKSEGGEKDQLSLSNYATIVAAEQAFRTYGMILNFKDDEDPVTLREHFLNGGYQFPIRIASNLEAPVDVKPENPTPSTFSYIEPEGTNEKENQEMGTMVLKDGDDNMVRITRVSKGDSHSNSEFSDIVMTFTKMYDTYQQPRELLITRVTVPIIVNDEMMGTIGKAKIDKLYYNEKSMRRAYFESPQKSPFSTNFDPYAVVESHMAERDVEPDDSSSDDIDPENPAFSGSNQENLTKFIHQLTERVMGMQKEITESKSK